MGSATFCHFFSLIGNFEGLGFRILEINAFERWTLEPTKSHVRSEKKLLLYTAIGVRRPSAVIRTLDSKTSIQPKAKFRQPVCCDVIKISTCMSTWTCKYAKLLISRKTAVVQLVCVGRAPSSVPWTVMSIQPEAEFSQAVCCDVIKLVLVWTLGLANMQNY